MQKIVRAVYEQGVLRPLAALLLREHQCVTVTVSDDLDIPKGHPLLVSPDEWTEADGEEVDLEEVRRGLSGLKGSLSEAIIEERRGN